MHPETDLTRKFPVSTATQVASRTRSVAWALSAKASSIKGIVRAGSVKTLAEALGVTHSTICDWKRTGHIPGNRISQVSAVLHIEPTLLMGMVKQPGRRDVSQASVA